MNPREFASAAGVRPAPFTAQRRTTDYEYTVPAAPETVFPLLCPVREYEWLEDWTGELVYSESGVAEDNCVFKTRHPALGPMTWQVCRYEPPTRIEFVVLAPERVALRLAIALERVEGGTKLRWQRIFTGLSEEGNQQLGGWTNETERALSEKLRHFLETGEMLRRI
jgi:hypothetical protein